MSNNCLILNKTKNPVRRIICFTHSGSYASQYSLWEKHLPSGVECVIYERPGSGIRVAEKFTNNWPDLINDAVSSIKPFLDLPYVIYGHSLGASIAYEVAKILQFELNSAPLFLGIGDREAPCHKPDKIRYNLSDQEFGQMLITDYDMDADVVANTDIMEFFLPILRNDFKLADTYFDIFGEASDKIMSKIIVFRPQKTNDTIQSHLDWAKFTENKVEIIDIKGGHFFVFEHAEDFIEKLLRMLRTA